MKDKRKSKYYYDCDRNRSVESKINPKMFIPKEELEHQMKEEVNNIDYSKDKIPNYYKGQTYGYEARKVCEDFELSYNIGTAVTYLLRAEKKHETATQCIRKAINHLEFELDKIANKSIKKYK